MLSYSVAPFFLCAFFIDERHSSRMCLQHIHNLEMKSASTQNRTLRRVLEKIQPIRIC